MVLQQASSAGAPAVPSSSAASVARSIGDGKKHLLLAASGSVATIKLPLIIAAFAHVPNLSIRVVLTDHAAQFLAGQSAEQPSVESLGQLPHVEGVHADADEWDPPWTRGAPILHIELRRWADILVIAPMSANLLAKVANGFCDSLLTSVIRAWETDPAVGKRILVAPAMNAFMWTHPLTARQLATLRDSWGSPATTTTSSEGAATPTEASANAAAATAATTAPNAAAAAAPTQSWYEVLLPQSKALACGDVGQGGMMDWRDIVQVIRERLSLPADESVPASAP